MQGSLNLGAEFKGSKRYFFILKKGLINKNNTVAILFFLTAVPGFFCNVLKTWFELSRLKLYGSDLKGNKNYFELSCCPLIHNVTLHDIGKENSSHVREPGQSWILDSMLWIPDSRYRIPVFVSRRWIPDSLSCIPDYKC